LKVKKAAPAPTPGAAGSSGAQAPSTPPAAATVNDNLVDGGADEASLPGDFEYESDTNPNDDE
jgi:26S proteasome regulatory subunit N2